MTDKEFEKKHPKYIVKNPNSNFIWVCYEPVKDGYKFYDLANFDMIEKAVQMNGDFKMKIEEIKDIMSLFEWYIEQQSKLNLKLNPNFEKYQPTEEDIRGMEDSITGIKGDR